MESRLSYLAADTEPRGPLYGLAMALFCLELFLMLSRATEFFYIPKLVLVNGCAAFVAASLRFRFFPVICSRPGALLIGFTALMVISTPFGWWRGGALAVTQAWLPYLLLFLTGAQLMTGLKPVRQAMYVVAATSVFLAIMGLRHGTEAIDRLQLEGTGSVSNANDLATSLLFGLPCCIFIFLQFGKVMKAVAASVIVLILILAMQSGSRAGLLAIAAMAMTMLLSLRGRQKVVFLVVAILLGLVGYGTLPERLKARYGTIGTAVGMNTADNAGVGEAIESSEMRWLLFKQSLKLTLQHPFLGVGPGNFVYVNNEDLVGQGGRKPWMVSHNSYTQVSSELGIPGFLCYILLLIHAFRVTSLVRKRAAGRPDLRPAANLAVCARLMVVSYCCTSMFAAIAYKFYVPALAVVAYGLGAWLMQLPDGTPAGAPAERQALRARVTRAMPS